MTAEDISVGKTVWFYDHWKETFSGEVVAIAKNRVCVQNDSLSTPLALFDLSDLYENEEAALASAASKLSRDGMEALQKSQKILTRLGELHAQKQTEPAGS